MRRQQTYKNPILESLIHHNTTFNIDNFKKDGNDPRIMYVSYKSKDPSFPDSKIEDFVRWDGKITEIGRLFVENPKISDVYSTRLPTENLRQLNVVYSRVRKYRGAENYGKGVSSGGSKMEIWLDRDNIKKLLSIIDADLKGRPDTSFVFLDA